MKRTTEILAIMCAAGALYACGGAHHEGHVAHMGLGVGLGVGPEGPEVGLEGPANGPRGNRVSPRGPHQGPPRGPQGGNRVGARGPFEGPPEYHLAHDVPRALCNRRPRPTTCELYWDCEGGVLHTLEVPVSAEGYAAAEMEWGSRHGCRFGFVCYPE